MKGLIIREPWIGKILAGQKTWEMRTKPVGTRGPIALIAKGTGTVVGLAELVGVGAPLNRRELAETIGNHGIPFEQLDEVVRAGWVTPWHLAKVRRLRHFVSYKHPSGAVTWVVLSAEVERAVWAAVGEAQPAEDRPGPQPTSNIRPRESGSSRNAVPLAPRALSDEVLIEITQGNLNNNHFYINAALHFFPQDVFGGSKKAESAPRRMTVTFSPGQTVETDVPKGRNFLRERAPIGDFFARSGAKAGDRVRLVRRAPYALHVSLVKAA